MNKGRDFSDILQRTDVTDDEKQKLFNTYFERYLELRRQKETPVMKEQQQQQQQQQAEPQLSLLLLLLLFNLLYTRWPFRSLFFKGP